MKRNGKRISCLLLSLALLFGGPGVFSAQADEDRCQKLLESMSLQDKLCQMIMPSLRYILNSEGQGIPVTTLPELIAGALAKYSFGGVILFAENTPENEQTFRLISDIQKANARTAGRTQLLISVDQEGGNITRLGESTQMPGNMALGAVGAAGEAFRCASLIGSELAALGFHIDFAPSLDINSNLANPVIGLRSFSSDSKTVKDLGLAFIRGLSENGIIATPKHFPGHGDTATDSHTGLPRIDKSREELLNNELVPFRAAVEAGVEMIMTAHIEFPQIETGTYRKANGEEVRLPATLSAKMINGILRGDLGFEGVVITDSMVMGAIEANFDAVDAAVLAINAGVDILLMPVELSSTAALERLDKYLAGLKAAVADGRLSMETVNRAVLRILRLKDKHGLLDPYDSASDASRLEKARTQVGSKAHHEAEWEITKKAVTLLKNDNAALPLTRTNEKTVILTAYEDEPYSMEYALSLLRDEGKMASGAVTEVRCARGHSREEVLSWTSGADNVIAISEMYNTVYLGGESASLLDAVRRQVQAAGGRFIIMSTNLPYDAARFPEADAIILCYGAKAMSEDPRVSSGSIKRYGPNLPACLYLMFSGDESPSGRVPVDIPALTESYGFSSRILFERGFGLRYEAVTPVPPPVTDPTTEESTSVTVPTETEVFTDPVPPETPSESESVPPQTAATTESEPIGTSASETEPAGTENAGSSTPEAEPYTMNFEPLIPGGNKTEPETSSFPWVPVAAAVLALAGGTCVFLALRGRNHRKRSGKKTRSRRR